MYVVIVLKFRKYYSGLSNKGPFEGHCMYSSENCYFRILSRYIKNLREEDNFSTKDKMAEPNSMKDPP